MTSHIFDKLFNGGRYALPYLVKFNHPTAGTYCFVNNNENVEYNDEEYIASSFDYTPPKNDGTGATLTITGVDNELVEWIENSDSRISIEIVGVLIEDGSVFEIRQYRHFFGSVSYSDDMSLEFNLGSDDRLDMTFNPYVYDTDNNRGNA